MKDQFGDLSAPVTQSIQLDPGPIAGTGAVTVGHNTTVNETNFVKGLVTGGLTGDTETVTAVTGNASLSGGTISYTAPSTGPDRFGYTVTDQLGDTAQGTVNVTVDRGPAAGLVELFQDGDAVAPRA